MAEFFDAIVLGDGEEIIGEIASLLLRARDGGLPRSEVLHRLAGLSGVYVPSLFAPEYQDDRLIAVHARKPGYDRVRRRVLPELGPAPYLHNPLVPVVKPVHDRLGIEICMHNCAGWSSSGGPWVKPDWAMQILTIGETRARGPKRFEGKLAQPPSKLDYYRDIAVVAFDDFEWGDAFEPRITTAAQPAYAIGERGARTLIDRFDDPFAPPHTVRLPVDIVHRTSCGCTPLEPRT